MKLSETLAQRAMAVTVVDMSFCGIGHGGEKLFNNFSLHGGLLQLNLSGNPLEERVSLLLPFLTIQAILCSLIIGFSHSARLFISGLLLTMALKILSKM